MKRLALTLMLPASMLLIGSAQAGPAPETIARMTRTSTVVPTDWDGYWTTVDSVYTCEPVFQSTSTGADTICGGKDYSKNPPGTDISLTCTGTADATTIDVTCTGSGPLFTDCDANYTIVTHGTRTDDTYFIVSTINVTYSGLACDGYPPLCIQVNSHGTRTGPAPVDYCATPTKRSSWGEIKAIYR
jgi:hypothetical protein